MAMFDDAFDRVHADEAQPLRFLERSCQVARLQDSGEIDKRPGDRCDRNMLLRGSVFGIEMSRPVDCNAGATASTAARRSDVDPRTAGGGQPP
jgi:hypothetical protein